MRSFAVLLSLLLFGVQTTSYASYPVQEVSASAAVSQGSEKLFTVVLPKTEQTTFQSLLVDAMRIELVRLAGTRKILNNPESRYFLEDPKLWLKTYGYKPQLMDGVVVGQSIYFEFAEQRLYEAFQKKNLQIWPYAKRPKLLVMMSENLGGSQTQFIQENLDYRSDIDLRTTAEKIALPIRLPRLSSDWLLPDSELKIALLQEVLQDQREDYLLEIEIKQSQSQTSKLTWTLYGQQLERIDQQTIALTSDVTTRKALADTLLMLFERFSAPYLSSANVLGQFNLQVSGVERFEDLKALEEYLQLQKPQFRQVKLLSLSKGVAEFDIEYQGDYGSAIKHLLRLKSLQMQEDNALIGQAKVQWVQ